MSKVENLSANNYVILSDSCCDLNRELREQYDIDYVPMHYSCDGKDYDASLDWEVLSAKQFYDLMRSGKRILTAQVNGAQYKEKFDEILSSGKDVLYISCSSALSNSVKASYLVRDELSQKYPERKIICVDSLNSSYGLGILCMAAAQMRAEGKCIEEVADWLVQNRKTVNQECTVDKLSYLKQAGRVSAASAFFGGLLNVKPIIISDVNGQNVAVEKVKGRKTSIMRIVERFKAEYIDLPYQKIQVVHADCIDEAMLLKEELAKIVPDKKEQINIDYIGPIVGASTGPGTMGVYFLGKTVEFKAE